MLNNALRYSIKSFIIGICFGIGFLTSSLFAVNITSTFAPGQILTSDAMNEIKDALVALPNWLKGVNTNDAVYTDGNVGIGTTTPTEMLEVNGTVKALAFVGDGSGLTGISGFSDQFSTGDQVFGLNSLQQYTHGLGGVPNLVIFELVCIVANNGYSVGDRVPFNNFAAANSGIRTAGYDSTYVFFKIGDNGYGSIMADKTGIGTFHPSPAQWMVNVRAWR